MPQNPEMAQELAGSPGRESEAGREGAKVRKDEDNLIRSQISPFPLHLRPPGGISLPASTEDGRLVLWRASVLGISRERRQ